MIRVTLEMVPKGDESKAYTLAQGMIINDGTGTLTTGNYIYGLSAQRKRPSDEPPIAMSGKLEGFPRKREDVWDLLRRVLNQGDRALIASDGQNYQDENDS